MIQLQRILLPTDLSEPSRMATEYAVDLSKRFGAALHLLYVIEEPAEYTPLGGYFPSREEWQAFADTALQNWLPEDSSEGLEVVRAKVFGHPVEKINEYAMVHNMDLIVMGTHGRSAISHLIMGSVAENVVRTSKCPVFTVRQKKK
ncbi:MAG: universal stress protein [Planctomycetaceae bacterium]|nr:universal stress protein [Planctomycetaceae bacterium]